jgi:hypothetical protein
MEKQERSYYWPKTDLMLTSQRLKGTSKQVTQCWNDNESIILCNLLVEVFNQLGKIDKIYSRISWGNTVF